MSSDSSPPLTPVVTPSTPPTLPSDGRFDGFSAALTHVLREIFDIRDTDPIPVLIQALKESGIREMYEFIDTTTDYEQEPYDVDPPHENRPRPTAARAHMTKVITLQAYLREHIANTGNPEMVDAEWLALTNADYRRFRNQMAQSATAAAAGTSAAATSPHRTTNSSSTAPDVLFKKGIRRDPLLFPVLKDLKYYLVWHREFVGQCLRCRDLLKVDLGVDFVFAVALRAVPGD